MKPEAFFAGLFQGGANAYERNLERKMVQERTDLQRAETMANIAAANEALKAQQFERQQAEELASFMRTPYRQAVGGLPQGFIGPPTEQQAPIQEHLSQMGPAAELPMRAVPQFLDVQRMQNEATRQAALLELERAQGGRAEKELGLRERELGMRGAEWAPISPAAVGVLGPEYAGMPRGELALLPRVSGEAPWGTEEALRLFSEMPGVQENAFEMAFGQLMQANPDLATSYDSMLRMQMGKAPTMSQMMAMVTPEDQQRVMMTMDEIVRDQWMNAMQGGMGMPFSTEEAPPDTSGVPTMAGYESPAGGASLDQAREQILQQYPWLAQPQYDEPAPETGETKRDYIIRQLAMEQDPVKVLAKLSAATGTRKPGGKGKGGGGGKAE